MSLPTWRVLATRRSYSGLFTRFRVRTFFPVSTRFLHVPLLFTFSCSHVFLHLPSHIPHTFPQQVPIYISTWDYTLSTCLKKYLTIRNSSLEEVKRTFKKNLMGLRPFLRNNLFYNSDRKKYTGFSFPSLSPKFRSPFPPNCP